MILAAGASTRMGTPKQLLRLDGTSLLRRAVQTAIASVCRPIIVVIGANAEKVQPELEGLPVSVVLNSDWSRGMGTSIRAGIAAVGAVDAVMIFLCDQPLVTAGSLDDLVASHFRSNKPISAATYGGTAGTPVIFAADLFPELHALGDAQGGKSIIQRYPQELNSFPLTLAEADVDTPQDYNRICRDRERPDM